MTKQGRIQVVEGKWYDERNTSIRSMFDLIADIHTGNPHAYRYEMFCDGNALVNIIRRASKEDDVNFVYVACHGSDPEEDGFGLVGSDGNRISRTIVSNAFRPAKELGNKIEGVFFGSCFFGAQSNADFLFDRTNNRKRGIAWCAGYTKAVDFIDSTVLDMYFFSHLIRMKTPDPTKRIESVAKKIKSNMKGLAAKLGLNIYVPTKSGSKNLLE